MLKHFFIKGLKELVERIIFPICRWYRSNLFLFRSKNEWLRDKPSFIWMVFGRPYIIAEWFFQKIESIYFEAIVKNYGNLIKKHYLENYAYNDFVLSEASYKDLFNKNRGSMAELFENRFYVERLNFMPSESFLDCGCGLGSNIKEIFHYFPDAHAIGFDLSSNAIDFAKKMFIGKNIDLFRGSVLEPEIFARFPDRSIDNVFFANMFSLILSGDIEGTRKERQRIISEAVRIARKNIILNEKFVSSDRIYIEQKYRAVFSEDFSVYFDRFEAQGNLLISKNLIIFHKRH